MCKNLSRREGGNYEQVNTQVYALMTQIAAPNRVLLHDCVEPGGEQHPLTNVQ